MSAFNFRQRNAVRLVLVIGLVLTAFAWGFGAASADSSAGTVYTQTNAAGPNAVLALSRSSNGSLSAARSFATGGNGTGSGLGSQGALVLSRDGRWLFAVNAGSSSITSFAVLPDGLSLVSVAPSGGTMPVSVTSYENLVYVLNAGASGNISGFTLSDSGALTPLSDSTRPLSGNATGPAQIQFSPDGSVLVVTEKNTNKIDTYAVGPDGRPGQVQAHASSGAVPFGFDFTQSGTLVVAEAGGGPAGTSAVSSYKVWDDAGVQVISASVPDTQQAACWLVVTQNGRYAFTANAASDSISSYKIGSGGRLTLLKAVAAQEAANSHPIDMALSVNSHYLYQLNTFSHTIAGFKVSADGGLMPVGHALAVPASTVGLAAR